MRIVVNIETGMGHILEVVHSYVIGGTLILTTQFFALNVFFLRAKSHSMELSFLHIGIYSMGF